MRRNNAIRLLSFFRPHRRKVAAVLAMMAVSSAIVSVLPLFAEHAVDADVASKDIQGLAITCILGILLALIWCILTVFRQRMLSDIANSIVFSIREELFSHIMKLSLSFFDSRPSGRVLSRLIGDITSLKELFRQVLDNLVPNSLMLMIITLIMLLENPILSVSAFAVLPILILGAYFTIVRCYSRMQEYKEELSVLNGFSHESFEGIRVLQSFTAERDRIEKADGIIRSIEGKWNRIVRRSDFFGFIISLSQGLGYFILYCLAIRMLEDGTASLGQVLAYASYIGLFWQPIRSLSTMYNQMVSNLAGAERVFSILDTEPDIKENPEAIDLGEGEGSVEFDRVSFSYPGKRSERILDSFSLKARPGERIALVGPTGAGKSTIISLICRFYDPVEGRVMIDGQDIAKASFRSLRRRIAVMTQDVYLFPGTVRDNILYGSEDESESTMRCKARALGLDSFFSSLPDGYDTDISSICLSEGQKQLIALLRTMIRNPRILVLDEATSAIDSVTEEAVQHGIMKLTEGRTSFIVAHRLSTVRNADRILFIDGGRIVEEGSHEELMAKHGRYCSLCTSQGLCNQR